MKEFYVVHRKGFDTRYSMFVAKTPKKALKIFKNPHRGYLNKTVKIEYDEILYVSEIVDGQEVKHFEKPKIKTSTKEGKQEYMREYRKKYYEQNRDKILERKREYSKRHRQKWYKKPKEAICEK